MAERSCAYECLARKNTSRRSPRQKGRVRMPPRIGVLLVDDHHLVRRGFRRLLEDEADISVLGEAGDGDEAIRLAKRLKPRVVLMDCALPGTSGLVATKK